LKAVCIFLRVEDADRGLDGPAVLVDGAALEGAAAQIALDQTHAAIGQEGFEHGRSMASSPLVSGRGGSSAPRHPERLGGEIGHAVLGDGQDVGMGQPAPSSSLMT
jgi:hypothetical protein